MIDDLLGALDEIKHLARTARSTNIGTEHFFPFLTDFLKEALSGRDFYYEVFGGFSTLDNIPILVSQYRYPDLNQPKYHVLNAAGEKYGSHAAYCASTREPLWIEASDGRELRRAERENLIERIKGIERHKDLPPYRVYKGEKSVTSILIPISVTGVWVLEVAAGKITPETPSDWNRPLAYSRQIFAVFNCLARTIGTVVDSDASAERARREFIEDLSAAKQRANSSQARRPAFFSRPTIFLAYPSPAKSCSMQIKEIVKRAIEGRNRERRGLEWLLIDWAELGNTGGEQVEKVVFERLAQCRLGIAYLSEYGYDQRGSDVRTDGRGDRDLWFQDNANVLFEIGMLSANKSLYKSPLKNWVMIREDRSSAINFDLAHLFRIEVKRQEHTNKLLNDEELQRRIEDLLDQNSADY